MGGRSSSEFWSSEDRQGQFRRPEAVERASRGSWNNLPALPNPPHTWAWRAVRQHLQRSDYDPYLLTAPGTAADNARVGFQAFAKPLTEMRRFYAPEYCPWLVDCVP
jgi:hypothetical protein